MVNAVAGLLGAVAVPVFILLFLALVVCAWCMPFMALSVTRNVRAARIALERIADANESGRGSGGGGVLGI